MPDVFFPLNKEHALYSLIITVYYCEKTGKKILVTICMYETINRHSFISLAFFSLLKLRTHKKIQLVMLQRNWKSQKPLS